MQHMLDSCLEGAHLMNTHFKSPEITFNEMYEACELFYPSLMSLNNLPVPNKTNVCVCRLAICPADLRV